MYDDALVWAVRFPRQKDLGTAGCCELLLVAADGAGDLAVKLGQGAVDVVTGEVLGVDHDVEPDTGSPVLDGDRCHLCHALDPDYDPGKVVTFDAIQ
jgi:hypothetical protein